MNLLPFYSRKIRQDRNAWVLKYGKCDLDCRCLPEVYELLHLGQPPFVQHDGSQCLVSCWTCNHTTSLWVKWVHPYRALNHAFALFVWNYLGWSRSYPHCPLQGAHAHKSQLTTNARFVHGIAHQPTSSVQKEYKTCINISWLFNHK